MHREELLTELASRIAEVRGDHPIRVAVDGNDASGKTTLANDLARPLAERSFGVIRASIDGFHNPASVRRRRGTYSPEGYFRDSFNYEGLITELLEPLGPGGTGRYRSAVFDFRSDSPVDVAPRQASPDSVLLFDGVFLLRPELRGYWDFSIFLRADFSVCLLRAERRDLPLFGSRDEVRARYERRYIPGQRIYQCEVQPERWATVVVENTYPDRPRIVRTAW